VIPAYLSYLDFLTFYFIRTSLHEAGTLFQADDARSIDHFASHLRSVLSTYSNVFVDVPPTHTHKPSKFTTKSILTYLSPPLAPRTEYDSIVEALSKSRRKPLAPKIAKLRAIKSESELRVMQQAADISGRAHAKVGDSIRCNVYPPMCCFRLCGSRGQVCRNRPLRPISNTCAL
jgi:Xaa-Pro aminopeptidase